MHLIKRYDEFGLRGQRPGEREQSRLMQHVMAVEVGHGLEAGAAADTEPGALCEQPFPYEPAVMPVTLVSVEAAELSRMTFDLALAAPPAIPAASSGFRQELLSGSEKKRLVNAPRGEYLARKRAFMRGWFSARGRRLACGWAVCNSRLLRCVRAVGRTQRPNSNSRTYNATFNSRVHRDRMNGAPAVGLQAH